jgi:hypothetical protein
MNPFSNNNENRQKTPELSPEDVEAINARRPVRWKSYANLYAVATSEQSGAPAQSLGSSALAGQTDPRTVQRAYTELGLVDADSEAAA